MAATHADGVAAFYINGEKLEEQAYDTESLGFEWFAYTQQFHVGSWYGKKDYYQGDVGAIRLYTRSLNSEEVGALYADGR